VSLEEKAFFVANSSNPFAWRTGESYNWTEQIRSRAQRSASISTPTTAMPGGLSGQAKLTGITPSVEQRQHQQQQQQQQQPQPPPVKEMPKAPRVPDPFQERILKGDFYMD
jgi:hypothetical protein